MCKKILLVGGGTGGHVFPLRNLVEYIDSRIKSENNETVEFHWIGEAESIESRVTSENHIPFSPIVCGKLRRYFSLQTILVPFQVFVGFFQSLWIINNFGATAIFSKGGYVSIPVALASWVLRVPVYLHESDSIPGLANRIVGRFAKGIFCAFSEADSYFDSQKILGHGSLLSAEIQDLISSSDGSSGQARGGRTQVLVSCGSQGSSSIFDAVLDILKNQIKAPLSSRRSAVVEGVGKENEVGGFGFHIILGVKNLDYREKFVKFPNVTVYDFFYDQAEYLRVVQQCDVVIARSGSSIFEFEALGLHMILIPHPHTGNNHQYWNAIAFQKKGHELLQQKNIDDLKNILEKYRTYKKSSEKRVVDRTIFDTIGQTLLK